MHKKLLDNRGGYAVRLPESFGASIKVSLKTTNVKNLDSANDNLIRKMKIVNQRQFIFELF
jgi:hypothetical protein